MTDKIAIISVRTKIGASEKIRKAIRQFGITGTHQCVIKEKNSALQGALKLVNSMITWGEPSEETIKNIEPYKKENSYHLQPPFGGYGRKGIKISYKQKGATGNRGIKINELIKNMLPQNKPKNFKNTNQNAPKTEQKTKHNSTEKTTNTKIITNTKTTKVK